MTYRLKNSHTYHETVAGLETVRLSAHELATARAQLLRAEAVAEFVHRVWIATNALARRVIAAIARKSIALADSFADSAMRSGERQRDAYLAQATDTADLEQRIRFWQARRYVIRN